MIWSERCELREPRLVPEIPETFEEQQRVQHLDLPEVRTGRLFAERRLLLVQLASRVWHRRRGFVCVNLGTIVPVTDWLQQRIGRIDQELARRQEAA
jgi:hypothetical protein